MSQFELSQLGRPSSPPFFRVLLNFVGSLVWTVLLLILYFFVLAIGTFIEKIYGDGASKFGIYGTWWFNGMAILLAVNTAAGLAAKFPWKRSQLGGFVLPHAGLLVLLIGCLISRLFGQELTLAVVEKQDSAIAYKSQKHQHVELNGQEHFVLEITKKQPLDGDAAKSKQTIEVPFTPGPFNWDDYNHLSPFPWCLAHRDRGVLYDHDGVRLEALDYCSDAAAHAVPSVRVTAQALNADGGPQNLNGRDPNGRDNAPINLEIPVSLTSEVAETAVRQGIERRLPGGQLIRFSMASSKKDMSAFLETSSVTEAKDKTDDDKGAMIELLQGIDHKLYMRTRRGGKVVQFGAIDANKRKAISGKASDASAAQFPSVPVFQGTSDALNLQLSDFIPSDRPQIVAKPLEFDHEKDGDQRQQQVLVRLTIDGNSDEFWLAGLTREPVHRLMIKKRMISLPNPIHRLESDSRQVVISLEPESVELGLKIHLKKAWRRLDPGTKQASYYASVIDLAPNEEVMQARESANPANVDAAAMKGQEDLLITLNAPLDFTDPATGISYRMFQTDMSGPFPPQQIDSDAWEPVYVSYLTLNHDPGRGWTYLGCLMVVAGVFLTYFGKKISVT